MADLYITEQGVFLSKSGETLQIKKDGEKIFKIELKNIDSIQLYGNIQFSTELLSELLERSIPLSIYSFSGKLLGRIVPAEQKDIELRVKQYDLYKNEAFRLEFSKRIITQKMEGCIHLLTRKSEGNRVISLAELAELKVHAEKCPEAESIESLLGIEGSFATKYFDFYGSLFKNKSLFNGRSKRPPKDPANSIMSFLYSIMTTRIADCLNGVGLDPYLGYLHSIDHGRASLACDVVEIIRPYFCDRVAMKLFNLGVFTEKDFEKDGEGVLLLPNPRKVFFKHLTTEMRDKSDYGIVMGDFLDFIKKMISWLKTCIREEKVIPLG